MQLISFKRQSKNHRSSKQKSLFKCAIHSFFKNVSSPGEIPMNIAIIGSYLITSLIFLIDIFTGTEVAFHILYVFPLIFIALHSSRNSSVIAAVMFSMALQLCEILYFQKQALNIQVYLFLIIAFSNSICVMLTRYIRANILEAQQLSTIDPLTKLSNRSALENALNAEAVRQKRYGSHFSVALIDLDGFKGLNDSMGHKAGDQALVLLADILRNQTRQSDTIARLGGDEFVILMPNTRAADCEALCHLFCHQIGVRMLETFSYPVTASIGFTTVEHWADLSGDILSIADDAMYQAKSFGKSRVVRGYAKELMDSLMLSSLHRSGSEKEMEEVVNR